jgi:hypothetical protein
MSWESELTGVIGKILSKKESELFRAPVPYESLGLLDYPIIIKKPMDLGTVKSRLKCKYYNVSVTDGLLQCISDIRQIWLNALIYNPPGSVVYTSAHQLSLLFESLLEKTKVCSSLLNSCINTTSDYLSSTPTVEMLNQWLIRCQRYVRPKFS